MRLEDLPTPGIIPTSQSLRTHALKAINFVQVMSMVPGWTSHADQLSVFFATCMAEVDKLIRVPVFSISAAGGGSTANGGTRQLTVTVNPAATSDKRVTWTSADPAKVSVNPVTGLATVRVAAAGAVIITAASVDNPTKTSTVTVTGT